MLLELVVSIKFSVRSMEQTYKPHLKRPQKNPSGDHVPRTRGERNGRKKSFTVKREKKDEPQKYTKTGPENKLKIIVLGGCEEVGRNMTLLEYGNDIILIDMGLQFPEEDMPGIDYIIPNIEYLQGKEKNIRAVIITHGHYDHIGAIPHLMPKLGNPPLYTTRLALGIIQKRQEDFSRGLPFPATAIDIEKGQLQLGVFRVEFFRVDHNIPDSMGLIVHTPEGIVVHTGDFKIDHNPSGVAGDIAKIAKLHDQNVLVLMSDSTNAQMPGFQISEKEIKGTLEQILLTAKGRIIIGTFASMLNRIKQVIEIAEKTGHKVLIEGYSMKNNVEIARNLGYMQLPRGVVLDNVNQALGIPKNKLIIICTGAQGEDKAALMRIANREHRYFAIEAGDMIIFSSSVIPGNERTVQRLKDTLYREGAKVIHYQMMDIHAGGHAKQEDLKLILRLVNPRFFMPIEGNHYFLKIHAELAESIGMDPKNIFVADNGQVVEFQGGKGKLTNKKVPADYVFVDGLGVGDVSNIVLRDRRTMAEDGMCVIIATIDARSGALIGSPDIISRGFIYLKENKEIIDQTREKVKNILRTHDPKAAANDTYIKNKIRDDIGQFLFSKTNRRPMILPVVIEV